MKKQAVLAGALLAVMLPVMNVNAAAVDSEGETYIQSAFALEDVQEYEADEELMLPKASINRSMLISNNVGHNNYYGWYNWSQVMNSYLTANADGTYMRVQYADGNVYCENYDSRLAYQSTRKIAAELEKFGGFYDDGANYYLVFGQDNNAEDDNREVLRIVKYSRQWERLGAASLYGANTSKIFEAGNMRMTAYDGSLYIRAAHQMYRSSDGYRHQSCMTVKVNTSDMTIADSAYTVQNNSAGYVSHSFNQFIRMDEGNLVALDHGDGYPRSAVLSKYYGDALGVWENVETVDTLKYAGSMGENMTNATVGGLEISDTCYLTAGSSAAQDGKADYRSGRNIYVTATSKTDFSEAGTSFAWITDSNNCGNPYLVEINKNKYLLIWEENSEYAPGYNRNQGKGYVRYAFLDGRGSVTGKICRADADLSDCQPIYCNRGVMWYVSTADDLIFYWLDTNTGALNKKSMLTGEEQSVNPEQPGAVFPFTDVPGHLYYAEPVKWAVEKGITSGTSATTFSPDQYCSRAQIVTFLWRAAGCPEPASVHNPFTDVSERAYYYKAVLWAVEKNITAGTSAVTFSPDDFCTRGQAVTFQYRYAGKPSVGTSNPFRDVSSGSYYYQPILWAVEKGITNGTSADAFSPEKYCTRGQIVTFLWRQVR